YQSYFFDENKERGYTYKIGNYAFLLELFCPADHGTTLSYARNEKGVIPVLKEIDNTYLKTRGVQSIHRSVLSFVDYLIVNDHFVNMEVDLRPAIMELLNKFYNQPTKREVEAFAKIQWEDDLVSDHVNPVVRKLGWKDLYEIIRKRSLSAPREVYWLGGIWKISPLWIRSILRLMVFFRKVYKTINHDVHRNCC
ncbi:MAG: hypothetical protein PHS88_01980, partial [Candidatus Omnitrophica bacterium]|nr:hypothetical protein [Candidatus Omnitrophota bacterium]